PTEVFTTEVLRGRKTVRPKTAGQKAYVDAVRRHTVTFCIGPAGTGKSYLAVALAGQALQAKETNRIILTRPALAAPPRPSLPPAVLPHRAPPRPGGRPPPEGPGRPRGRAAGVHAGTHAQRLFQNPRRGPEPHARADEDVPHPPRLRLAHRGHRRRHPDR